MERIKEIRQEREALEERLDCGERVSRTEVDRVNRRVASAQAEVRRFLDRA